MRNLREEHRMILLAHYHRLNKRHSLFKKHRISLDRFMKVPNQCNRALNLYFRNPCIFTHRAHGAPVILSFFLAQPDEILLALLRAEQLAKQVPEPEFLPLLPRQRAVQVMQDAIDDGQFDGLTNGDTVIMCGGAYKDSAQLRHAKHNTHPERKRAA